MRRAADAWSASAAALWLERDYGKSARELLLDGEFVERYVVDLALGLKAAIMLLNPRRIVIGGVYIEGGRPALRAAAAGVAAADHQLVRGADRRGAGSAGRR